MRRLTSLLALLATVATAIAVAVLATGSPSAQADAAPSARTTSTKVVTVRPVTSAGKPAPGWTVKKESGSVSCSGASPAALDDGITSCYPTAYALGACWKSQHHTVLCVRDARSHRLTRLRYQGSYPHATAPKVVAPSNLVLDGGRVCDLRVGGAWGAPEQHPNWLGDYSCTHRASVYGPPQSHNGINRSHQPWSVHLWRTPVKGEDDIVVRSVTTAYELGTAA